MTIQVEILHFLHYNPSSGRDFILDCPDYLDCSTLNVPPISLSNVPGISE